jgi:hypothetical protein
VLPIGELARALRSIGAKRVRLRRPAMGVANGRQPPRCKALSGFPPYVSAGAERILRAVWLETGQRVLAEEH